MRELRFIFLMIFLSMGAGIGFSCWLASGSVQINKVSKIYLPVNGNPDILAMQEYDSAPGKLVVKKP